MPRQTISAHLARSVCDDAALGRPARLIAQTRGLSLASVHRLLNGSHPHTAGRGLGPVRTKLPHVASEAEIGCAVRLRLAGGSVTTPLGCWIYPSTSLRLGGQHVRLARASYIAFVGAVPDRLRVVRCCHPGGVDCGPEADCGNRCWRPDHLRLRGAHDGEPDRWAGRRGLASACPAGHDFTLDNTRFRSTRTGTVTRACRRCARDARRCAGSPDSGQEEPDVGVGRQVGDAGDVPGRVQRTDSPTSPPIAG